MVLSESVIVKISGVAGRPAGGRRQRKGLGDKAPRK